MMSGIFLLAVIILWSTRLMNFNHVHLCFTLLIRCISHYMLRKTYFIRWVKLKKLSWRLLPVYFHFCDPVNPLNKTAAMQPEGTIFSLWVITSASNPPLSSTLILSLQRLLHAASKSLTQLSVVTRHVSPDLWHTASRKALQDDWSSSQKVLEERCNFQRARHFRFHIAVFIHWTTLVVLILHSCPS